jgi:hypothetical protein
MRLRHLAWVCAALGLANAAVAQTTPSLADTSVILNLYGLDRQEVAQAAVNALAPLVRSNDVFLLVSGNHKGAPNIALVARWAETLHKRFPQMAVWTLTSGLANVKALAESREKIPACVTTIIYDYEPKWDNEPEFDADFVKTLANFTQAASIAHGGKFALGGAPTGRPLLKNEFARYGWDYGRLAQMSGADGMIVQTQTYCKNGIAEFKTALEKLKAQQTGAGLPLDRVYPQVTVDLNSTNGAKPQSAVDCIREARREGFSRIALWFTPARVEGAVEFLTLLGRQDASKAETSRQHQCRTRLAGFPT